MYTCSDSLNIWNQLPTPLLPSAIALHNKAYSLGSFVTYNRILLCTSDQLLKRPILFPQVLKSIFDLEAAYRGIPSSILWHKMVMVQSHVTPEMSAHKSTEAQVLKTNAISSPPQIMILVIQCSFPCGCDGL